MTESATPLGWEATQRHVEQRDGGDVMIVERTYTAGPSTHWSVHWSIHWSIRPFIRLVCSFTLDWQRSLLPRYDINVIDVYYRQASAVVQGFDTVVSS